MINYLIANGYNYDGTTTIQKISKALASETGWSYSNQTGAVGNTDYPEKRNATGFTGLPAGVRYEGAFKYEGLACAVSSQRKGRTLFQLCVKLL
ncbi:MAG TPA: hypothetical protein DDW27_02775 [Bacteroidales bacterium]|nr:hypothetical protein [Bacteroidales bacterium]